jgi:hypothetical protein
VQAVVACKFELYLRFDEKKMHPGGLLAAEMSLAVTSMPPMDAEAASHAVLDVINAGHEPDVLMMYGVATAVVFIGQTHL